MWQNRNNTLWYLFDDDHRVIVQPTSEMRGNAEIMAEITNELFACPGREAAGKVKHEDCASGRSSIMTMDVWAL